MWDYQGMQDINQLVVLMIEEVLDSSVFQLMEKDSFDIFNFTITLIALLKAF